MKKIIALSMITTIILFADLTSDKRELADVRKMIDTSVLLNLQKMQSLHSSGNIFATYALGSCNLADYFTPQCSDAEAKAYQTELNKDTLLGKLEALAQNGDANGAFTLGKIYTNEKLVGKDEIKAVELYKKAAELGNANAMVHLGWVYAEGKGVTKDEAKAMELLQKGADLGSGEAMAKIGSLYKVGDGVVKDEEEALRWLHKAIVAEPDYDWSYRGIAEIYRDRGDKDKYHEWNLKAVEKGSGIAMASLGELSLGKYGSNSYDANKAAEWFLKALATDKDSGGFRDNSETGKQRAKRILDELKATGKITDPNILKQVNAIFDPAPSLKWISIPKTINTQTLDVSVEANDQGGGIGDVQIFVDGKVVSTSDNRSLKKPKQKV